MLQNEEYKIWQLPYLKLKYTIIYLKQYSTCIKKINNMLFILLLIFFIWHFRHSLFDAIKISTGIGFNFLWLPLLFIIWNIFATAGWQSILKSCSQNVQNSFLQLYSIRIQSQTLNLLLPVSGIGGEALRSVKIKKGNGLQNSITSVVLDKMIDIVAEIALALSGVIIALKFFPHQKLLLSIAIALLLIIVIIFIFWNRLFLFLNNKWNCTGKEIVQTIVTQKDLGAASGKAFVHHLIEHILMAIEILVVAHLTGIQLQIDELFYVNTISSLFNVLFIIVPGRVGSYECSLAYAFSQLSLSPAAGVSIALIRRVRQLMVCTVGTLLMAIKNHEVVSNSKMSVQYELKKNESI